jgi:hypothetical protein
MNEGNPPLHKWIRECKKVLIRNEKSKKMGKEMNITFKQPKNIKRVVSSNCRLGDSNMTPPPPDPGCYKCNKCRVACPILKEGVRFTSTNTGKTYKIQQKVNCDSPFIIYLGTCKKCRGQYVGKSTNPFKKRHSGHKQEIKNLIGGLGHHYGGPGGCGYASVEIMIIEQVEIGNTDKLAEREVYWQHQLRCYVENGANGHCYRKEV